MEETKRNWSTHDFYYDLPKELIAQTPLEPRDSSRLLVLHKETGEMEHRHFYDVIDYLNPGDCLVLNDSRVLPARLYGIKDGTGAKVEFLLLTHREGDTWEVLTGPGKRAKPGTHFTFGDGLLRADVLDVVEGGNRIVEFHYEGNFYAILDQIGQMPLPHYITEDLKDKERYQNVYSKEVGSAAAPTAGLHFTPELLERIRQKGIKTAFVTLHVGLGTFRPVTVENVSDHKMHSEHYAMSKAQRWTCHCSWDNQLPHAGIHCLEGGRHPGECRMDRYLHLSRIPIPGAGRADYQFPFAGEHADHAGFRFGRIRQYYARLSHSGTGEIPVFQLWRCDVYWKHERTGR